MPARGFERLLLAVFRRRRAALVTAAAVGLAAAALLTQLRLDSNVLHLLPQQGAAVQAFQRYLESFGSLDRLYVVIDAPEHALIADYEGAIDQFVAALRGLPELAAVDAGIADASRDWSYLLDRQLLLLGPAQLDAALARLHPPALDEALAAARARLATPSPDVRRLVQQDPLGLLTDLRDRLAGERLPFSLDPAQTGYVSSDGRSRLLIAKPTEPPYDSSFARALNARVEALAAGLPPELRVRVAGGYRVSAETEAVIRGESIVNSVSSAIGITAILVVVLRSIRPVLAIAMPIGLASVLTLAVYGALFPLSPAAAASAAVLFGLGVDNALLLYLSYLERRRAGMDAATAIGSLGVVVMSVAIAFTTTTATFVGLLFVDLPALQDLGLIAGIGVLVCGAAAVLLFAAVAPIDLTPSQQRRLQTAGLARAVLGHRWLVITAAALVTAGLWIAAPPLRFTPTVQRLAPTSVAGDTEGAIAKQFNLPEEALFAVGEHAELEPLLDSHARVAEELAALGDDVTVGSPVTLLPPRGRQERLAQRLASAELDPAAIARELEAAAERAGFRPGSFQPFLERVPTLVDPAQRLTIDGYASHGLGDLLEHFVVQRDGRYRVVTYIYPRSADGLDDVEAAVARAAGTSLQLTGVSVVNRELERRFVPELRKGAIIGLAGVLVLLVAGFRSVRLAIWAMIPVTLGTFWSLCIVAIAGIELDLFSIFGPLMCVGIGVDYGVHLLHRAAHEPARGMTIALTNTTPSILLAALTTLLGFGSLIPSSYTPLHALGIVTTVTIASCLVAGLIVLPALRGDA
jgi:predicted RND superfamily exporter protein